MNIFLQELRINKKSLAYWYLTMLLLIGASVGKTSGLVDEGGQSLTAMLTLLPKPIQNLFGMGMVDFSQPISIFAIIALYLALIAAFHASGLGTAAFAREERDRTFEFLYVRGKTRGQILLSKALADLVMILLLNTCTWAFSVGLVLATENTNIAAQFCPLMLGILVIQLFCYALGLMVSFLTSKMRMAASITTGVIMVLFLLSIAAPIADIPALADWSPFGAFDGKAILSRGLRIAPVLIWLSLSGIMIIASFRLHDVRDLHT